MPTFTQTGIEMNVEDISLQDFSVEGTSQALEKQYLRLTAVSPYSSSFQYSHSTLCGLIPIPPAPRSKHSTSREGPTTVFGPRDCKMGDSERLSLCL